MFLIQMDFNGKTRHSGYRSIVVHKQIVSHGGGEGCISRIHAPTSMRRAREKACDARSSPQVISQMGF